MDGQIQESTKGRNPQTGEEMTIDVRKVITFKPSAVLKNAVKSGR